VIPVFPSVLRIGRPTGRPRALSAAVPCGVLVFPDEGAALWILFGGNLRIEQRSQIPLDVRARRRVVVQPGRLGRDEHCVRQAGVERQRKRDFENPLQVPQGRVAEPGFGSFLLGRHQRDQHAVFVDHQPAFGGVLPPRRIDPQRTGVGKDVPQRVPSVREVSLLDVPHIPDIPAELPHEVADGDQEVVVTARP